MKTLLALLAGALNALAFAPFGWWLLCLLSFAVLFGLWLRAKRGAAAWYGFVFGVGMFGLGTSWIYVSLHNFGGLPPWLAGLCVALLVAAVSLLPALAGWLQSYVLYRATAPHATTMRAILIMPSIWLLGEWLRGWLCTGFPWLTGGYAMLDTPLAGLAPLGGVYLVGLLALMSAGALLALLLEWSWDNLLLSSLLGLGWLGGWQLATAPWTQPQGAEISVAIVQNNVPLQHKWQPRQRAQIIADYLAQSARHRDVDLVVWPEAAVPEYLHRLPADFHRQLRAHPADFIFGALTLGESRPAKKDAQTGGQADRGQGESFNSIAAFTGADRTMLYHKRHLVPFGEFLPMKWLFQPLFARLNIPMSDFASWRAPQAPLRAAGNRFAASICYEDAFPQTWREQVASAGVLLNVSEDMWFGDSFAPHQRLQMARFRSLESARPMIRSSNNGLSSVINWRGGLDEVAPQFVKTVLTAKVQPRAGSTPYVQFGDRPALLFSALLIGFGWLLGRRKLR